MPYAIIENPMWWGCYSA